MGRGVLPLLDVYHTRVRCSGSIERTAARCKLGFLWHSHFDYKSDEVFRLTVCKTFGVDTNNEHDTHFSPTLISQYLTYDGMIIK